MNACRAARRGAAIKEGEIGAGRRFPVGIEEVIGADIVLVDGLLDQAHAERAGIEAHFPGASADIAVRWWIPVSFMTPSLIGPPADVG